MDNPIFQKPNLLQLFLYCLLKANHETKEIIFNNEIIKIEKGTFITGRFEIAKDLKMNPASVYKNLKKLEMLSYISLKSNNKFSMLTILKYNTYQTIVTTKEQQSNNKVTTKEQQSNTNKKYKNDKKEDRGEYFSQSPFIDFQLFKINFTLNDKYKKYDVNYYYEAVKNWSESKGAKKKDWIATARGFAIRDEKENKAKLKPISYKSNDNGKYDPSTAHL